LRSVLNASPVAVNASQFALEVLRQGHAAIALSQVVVEVLRGNGSGPPPPSSVSPFVWIIT
jgi:hypothetical protein